MWQIILIQAAALGHGTRAALTVLGRCGADPAELLAAAADGQPVPGQLELAEGIDPAELRLALRNPHLVEFHPADPPAPADGQPPPADPAEPQPQPGPPRAPRTRAPRKRS